MGQGKQKAKAYLVENEEIFVEINEKVRTVYFSPPVEDSGNSENGELSKENVKEKKEKTLEDEQSLNESLTPSKNESEQFGQNKLL